MNLVRLSLLPQSALTDQSAGLNGRNLKYYLIIYMKINDNNPAFEHLIAVMKYIYAFWGGYKTLCCIAMESALYCSYLCALCSPCNILHSSAKCMIKCIAQFWFSGGSPHECTILQCMELYCSGLPCDARIALDRSIVRVLEPTIALFYNGLNSLHWTAVQ